MFISCMCIFYGQIVVSFLLFWVNEIEEKTIFLFDCNCCNTVGEFVMKSYMSSQINLDSYSSMLVPYVVFFSSSICYCQIEVYCRLLHIVK